ncbi:AAA+ ATPase domain-containing protein [Artemisia annua]|uniref:AAA+ ATPase domain-containing protein n=1 Tax=Artemisia annua TaxID=35608 RepID=A0A2U1LRQ2_ARTAN|nr:AAA+ ATPase domain-containing protein [Artemisia annua]
MASQMFPVMPTTSSLLSAYASFSTTFMLFQTIFNQLVPPQLQRYIIDVVKYYWKPKTSKLTLLFEEKDGYVPNDMFNAVEVYLATKITPDSRRLKITKSMKESHINIKLAESEEIVDLFEGVTVTWRYLSQQQNQTMAGIDNNNSFVQEKKYMELKFDKNYKDVIITSYLPFIVKKAQEIKNQKKVVHLHNLKSPYMGQSQYRQTVNLDHPSTFNTLAMDQKRKKEIMADLDMFVRRKDFYKKVGKVWKRGYLLYGPPGTGKSSLIAAMANYLKFDIYDLQLTNVRDDSCLKDMLLQTLNRSLLVIEDIDCSIVPNRNGLALFKETRHDDPKFSLSGLLNFIDGLWSSCGDERIIVFTTNHKYKLDPALLRPGRMDMHIHMSYLTMDGFKTLAANYLNIHNDHWRFKEIEELINCKEVTPAEVAEELLKSDNVEVVLEGLVNFLKGKKKEAGETNEGINEDTGESDEGINEDTGESDEGMNKDMGVYDEGTDEEYI